MIELNEFNHAEKGWSGGIMYCFDEINLPEAWKIGGIILILLSNCFPGYMTSLVVELTVQIILIIKF